jgi:hypothetical protein
MQFSGYDAELSPSTGAEFDSGTFYDSRVLSKRATLSSPALEALREVLGGYDENDYSKS